MLKLIGLLALILGLLEFVSGWAMSTQLAGLALALTGITVNIYASAKLSVPRLKSVDRPGRRNPLRSYWKPIVTHQLDALQVAWWLCVLLAIPTVIITARALLDSAWPVALVFAAVAAGALFCADRLAQGGARIRWRWASGLSARLTAPVLLTIVGLCITFYVQVVYPRIERPSINVGIDDRQVMLADGHIYYELDFHATNNGTREVHLIDSAYGVVGHHLGMSEDAPLPIDAVGLRLEDERLTPPLDRSYELLDIGRIMNLDTVLRPQEQVRRRIVIGIPAEEYRVVTVVANWATTRRRGLVVDSIRGSVEMERSEISLAGRDAREMLTFRQGRPIPRDGIVGLFARVRRSLVTHWALLTDEGGQLADVPYMYIGVLESFGTEHYDVSAAYRFEYARSSVQIAIPPRSAGQEDG